MIWNVWVSLSNSLLQLSDVKTDSSFSDGVVSWISSVVWKMMSLRERAQLSGCYGNDFLPFNYGFFSTYCLSWAELLSQHPPVRLICTICTLNISSLLLIDGDLLITQNKQNRTRKQPDWALKTAFVYKINDTCIGRVVAHPADSVIFPPWNGKDDMV